MNIRDHYRTEFWEGHLKYGPFSGAMWFAIGGYKHPLFKAIVREIWAMHKANQYNIQDYELYVCGGLLEDWVSWDIDMVLVGPKSLDAYNIMYKIKKLGFVYRVYIDINLQQTSEGVFLNCGGINSDTEDIYIDAYEIANVFAKDGSKNLYQWPQDDFGLYKRELRHPFAKNLLKYQEEGYLYKSPKEIKEFFKYES